MKKKIIIVGLLVLVISMISINFVNGNKNQEMGQMNIIPSGTIIGWRTYDLTSYDSTNVINWGFSGAEFPLSVYLLDEENYNLWSNYEPAHGVVISSGRTQASGSFQCPFKIGSSYYLVFFNADHWFVDYTNMYVFFGTIKAEFNSVVFNVIDSDDDGFDDSIEIEVNASFDVDCYAEGYISVDAFLRELSTGKIIDTDSNSKYIENSGTIILLLWKQIGESGNYKVELEISSFVRQILDETFNQEEIFELHKIGKLRSIIFKACLYGGLSLLIVTISLISFLVVRKRRRQPVTQTDLTQLTQKICPNCKNEIAETGHGFCEHCGEAL